jgi:GR25 family glycosyltransferase involved in LPS biosynthesis
MKMIEWYVINLSRDVERWNSVEQEATSNNLQIQRVPAIESRNLKDINANFVAAGVRAAWLSHIKAMNDFLSSNSEFAIIAEDDFHIDNPSVLNGILATDSTFEFDLLQLGFLLPGVDTQLKFRLSNSQQAGFRVLSIISNFSPLVGFHFKHRMRVKEAASAPKGIVLYDCLPGAHCYLISRRFAASVIRLNQPQFLSIDDFYSALSKMRAFRMGRVKRSLVSQLPFKSWSGDRFKTI